MVWTLVSKPEDGLADQLLFVCSDVRDVVFLESGKKKKKSVLSSGKKEKHLGGEGQIFKTDVYKIK